MLDEDYTEIHTMEKCWYFKKGSKAQRILQRKRIKEKNRTLNLAHTLHGKKFLLKIDFKKIKKKTGPRQSVPYSWS